MELKFIEKKLINKEEINFACIARNKVKSKYLYVKCNLRHKYYVFCKVCSYYFCIPRVITHVISHHHTKLSQCNVQQKYFHE